MAASKIKFSNFLYNWMISSFPHSENSKKALDFFHAFRIHTSPTLNMVLNSQQDPMKKHAEMTKKGIGPDSITFDILIHGFSEANNVEIAVGFLKTMKNICPDPSIPSYTSPISDFIRKNKMQEVFSLFKLVKESGIELDELLYATLIHGFCRGGGLLGHYTKVYESIGEIEMTPTIVTYNILINGLCLAGRTAEAEAISRKIHGDVFTYTTLLHAYTKRNDKVGILEIKRRLWENGRLQVDVIMCNVLVRALFMVGEVSEAQEIYKKMKEKRGGLVANCSTFFTMIHGYFMFSMVDDAMKVFYDFRRSRLSSVSCYRRMISGICAHGGGTGGMGFVLVVLAAFVKAHGSEEGTDCGTLVIRRLVEAGYVSCAYGLMVCTRESVSTLDVYDYTMILDGLCKRGHMCVAADLCDIVRDRGIPVNIVMVNSIIGGLCREGHTVLAVEIFYSLDRWALLATDFTYVILIKGLCRRGEIDTARRVFDDMITKGVAPSSKVYKSLVRGYSCLGMAKEARGVFNDFEINLSEEVDGVTLGYMIGGYCRRGDVDEAIRLFVDFRGKGLSPDLSGFVRLMRGLCLKGRVEECRSVMREMLEMTNYLGERKGLISCMESLCAEGRVEEAVAVLAKAEQMSQRIYDVRDTRQMILKNNTVSDGYENNEEFDSFYSLVSTLCTKGETKKADELVWEMACRMG